jgi:hypothetical protein
MSLRPVPPSRSAEPAKLAVPERTVPERTAAEAVALAEDLGLGEVTTTARIRKKLPILRWILLAIIAPTVGLLEMLGEAGKARAITAGVFGVLFLLGCFMTFLGYRGGRVTRRLYCHAGGVVEYLPGEPEPRVVRWADVERVTISYYQPPKSVAMLFGCLLSGRDNAALAMIVGYPGRGLHRLVTEADRALAPRMVPPLIRTYESGEPVTFGGIRVDPEKGITVDPVTGSRVVWTDMRRVEIVYSPRYGHGATAVLGIRVRPRSEGRAPGVHVSGLPNGIFLPHLIAHAAERHGVQVRRYPRRAGDRDVTGAPPI